MNRQGSTRIPGSIRRSAAQVTMPPRRRRGYLARLTLTIALLLALSACGPCESDEWEVRFECPNQQTEVICVKCGNGQGEACNSGAAETAALGKGGPGGCPVAPMAKPTDCPSCP